MNRKYIRNNSKSIKMFLIVAFAILLFLGVNYCMWDNANASENNIKNGTSNGSSFVCDPTVRTVINVSDLPLGKESFEGNVDPTKYKDNKDHYLYDLQLCTKTFRGCGEDRFLHLRFNSESGWFFMDGVDYKFYITIEDKDKNVLGDYTVKGCRYCDSPEYICIDKEHATQYDSEVQKFTVNKGKSDTLRDVVRNPKEYEGAKIYVRGLWVED